MFIVGLYSRYFFLYVAFIHSKENNQAICPVRHLWNRPYIYIYILVMSIYILIMSIYIYIYIYIYKKSLDVGYVASKAYNANFT